MTLAKLKYAKSKKFQKNFRVTKRKYNFVSKIPTSKRQNYQIRYANISFVYMDANQTLIK